jgi:hypothetical protein
VPNETTGAEGTQAAPDAQPQAGASQAQAANGQSSQADGPDNASGTVDVAALQRELAEARKEAGKYRTEAQKAKDAAKAAEDAKLPEQERVQRRLAELEQANAAHERERTEWRTQAAVTKAALRLGFQDPVDAYALLDRAALDHDENGEPRNVDRLLADLLKAKPYLGGAGRPSGSADGGINGQTGQAMDMNARIRAAAGRT